MTTSAMNNTVDTTSVDIKVESNRYKLVQIIGAILLGMVLLYGVGFSPLQAAHDAAHDTRHSYGLPCH